MPYISIQQLPRPSLSKARGFTLIEMLVVVAIVGLLASAAIPFVRYGEHRLKERELRMSLREIRNAIDAFKKAADEGRIEKKITSSSYPENLNILVEGVTDLKSTDERKLYFLRRSPKDPFFPSNSNSKEGWGLRSYASPANAPQPGDDVYDVYSLNPGVGSNGVPYREW